jgi:hypothetical protein
MRRNLERRRVLAAELHAHDLLARVRPRTERRRRDVDLLLAHLDAAHLDAALDELLGALQVVGAGDLVEGHRDDVLVGRHAGGQDLRDARVGDDREAVRDGAGRRGVLEVVDLAEREHEGEHAVLVVEHDLARVAGVHAAEGERRAGCEAQGVHGGDGVDAEGHGEGVVAELYAFFLQLMDDAAAVDVPAQEDEDAAALQLATILTANSLLLAQPTTAASACGRRPAGCPRRAAGCRRWGR